MAIESAAVAAPSATRTRTPGEVARVGVVAAGAAVVTNLSVLLLGRVAGADMVLGRGSATQTVAVVPVVVATLIGLLAGTVLLVVVCNRGHRAWTAVAITGLVVGLATVPAPLSMAAETTTHATLAAMHAVTGLVWFLVVRRAARN